MWQTAYLATSVLLGEAADEALARLGEADRAAAAPLAAELASPSRERRAKALAAAIARIAQAADEGAIA